MSWLAVRLLCFVTVLASLSFGCTKAGQGNVIIGGLKAWIDAPLDGSTIPLAPYEVVSHGTDPGGISQVELSINGGVFKTDSAPGHTLVTMRQMWTPPGPGNYTLMVRAQAGGGWSDYAKAVVTVAGATATPTPSPARSASPTATPSRPASATATGTPTATASPLPPAGITFTADPSTITAGECSMLRWKVENVSEVFLENAAVDPEGSRRDCPPRTVSRTLRVTTLDGQPAQHSVTITVRQPTGTPTPAEQPPAEAPPVDATDTPVPPEPGITPPVLIVTRVPEIATNTPVMPPTATFTPRPVPPTPTLTPTIHLIVPPIIRTLPTASPTRRPEIVR